MMSSGAISTGSLLGSSSSDASSSSIFSTCYFSLSDSSESIEGFGVSCLIGSFDSSLLIGY